MRSSMERKILSKRKRYQPLLNLRKNLSKRPSRNVRITFTSAYAYTYLSLYIPNIAQSLSNINNLLIITNVKYK